MNKSECINELATALSKLQGEITDVHKDKKGYGYNYAELSSVLDIVRPLLTKHGLAVTQLCGSAHDKVTVDTVLMHTSGQWISSRIEMGVVIGKGMTLAQAVGSVITYARRYALAAIVGLAQTDNDAVAEQGETVKPIAPKTVKITSQQADKIKELCDGNVEKMQTIINHYKVASLNDLPSLVYNEIEKRLTFSKTQAERLANQI